MSRRTSPLLMLAVFALALAPSSAALARRPPRRASFTLYNVVYEGSGSYSVSQSDPPGSGETRASYHWRVDYASMLISQRQGSIVASVASVVDDRAVNHGRFAGKWSIASDNGGGETCQHSGRLGLPPGAGRILGRVERSGVTMQVIPGSFITVGGSSGSGACDTTDFWSRWVRDFSHIGSGQTDHDPLTAFVAIPRRLLSFGKIVEHVSNSTLAAPSLTANPDCGSGNGATCTQTFDWRGTVTFTKVAPPRRHH